MRTAEEVRAAQCGDKQRFLTMAEAKRRARWAHKKWKRQYDAYHCPWCGHHHIGSRRKPMGEVA